MRRGIGRCEREQLGRHFEAFLVCPSRDGLAGLRVDQLNLASNDREPDTDHLRTMQTGHGTTTPGVSSALAMNLDACAGIAKPKSAAAIATGAHCSAIGFVGIGRGGFASAISCFPLRRKFLNHEVIEKLRKRDFECASLIRTVFISGVLRHGIDGTDHVFPDVDAHFMT